jgi:hypothetical protein
MANAHCVQSRRWGRARDDLQNEPNRHATNSRIWDVYEFMMFPKRKVLLATRNTSEFDIAASK